MASKTRLIIFINILSVIRVSLLETVHFTNSPNKLFRATNYTTYKVEVPNGEPITIIEANQPLIDKKIKFDAADSAGKYSLHRNGDRRKQVVDLESTLSMTVTPNRNYENSAAAAAAAASAGDEESVTSDYSNLSHERNQKRNPVLKTVYSPELLQKFLKDYASKIHGSVGTASIEAVPSHQVHQQHHGGSVELEQAIGENNEPEKDKYESIETGDDAAMPLSSGNGDEEEEGNRRVSSAGADDEKESGELNDIQQRKNYRPNGNYNSNHPYDKNNGWVTLDAVPWSKSKVSKWHSNVKRYGSGQGNYNYQNGNNYGPRPSPPYRPPSGGNNYDYDYNGSSGGGNNDNDDYYASRPSRPTFHNNQYYHQSSRPPPPPPPQPPQDNYHQSSHHFSSSSHHHTGNEYDHGSNRPGSRPEIITDNRPSNFPSHGEEHHRPVYGQRPSYQHENAYHGGNYHSYKEGSLPQTYPHNGEGEWVLVSTTKGYQFPKRSGQRAMSFAAQNGFSQDQKYTDSKGIITAAGSQRVETFMRPHRSGPTKMSQQQVKLSVLPLFVNNEHGGGSNNNNYNDIDMGVYKPPGGQSSYGGLIETAQSNQTVEESAANANGEASAAPSTTNKTKKKKRKVMKNYLMRKSSAGGADSTAMIAAVGASLLPASLGLIAPMVLG